MGVDGIIQGERKERRGPETEKWVLSEDTEKACQRTEGKLGEYSILGAKRRAYFN